MFDIPCEGLNSIFVHSKIRDRDNLPKINKNYSTYKCFFCTFYEHFISCTVKHRDRDRLLTDCIQALHVYSSISDIELSVRSTHTSSAGLVIQNDQLNMVIFCMVPCKKWLVHCKLLLYTCTLDKSIFQRYVLEKYGHV